MHIQSIEHMLYECIIVKNFWLQLNDLWKKYNNQPLFLNYDVIMFGHIENLADNIKENILLMYAKKYIYDCKIKESQLSILHFKNFIVNKLTIVFQTNCKLKAEYAHVLEFSRYYI